MIKATIENNFPIILILGAVLGFFIPSPGAHADMAIILLLAGQVLLASASIKRDDLGEIDIFQVGLFSLLRYAIFPIFLYYVSTVLWPDYAIGVLLLALMPAAIVVASLCSISHGKTALGISLTVFSSVLITAFIPAVFSFLGYVVEVNILKLFITLVVVLFVPIATYFVVIENVKPAKKFVLSWGKAISVISIALVLMIIMASYKDQFIEDWEALIKGTLIMFVLFFFFYLFGFVFSIFVPKDQRSAYIYASGAMNNGLAIGLAFLYFSPQTTFFIVISELVWCIYVPAAQWYFMRQERLN
jgi:BASS family bile acid:Na+ symporter